MSAPVAPPTVPAAQPSDPEPLRRDLGPSLPYPLDALGPIMGPAARACAEIIRAPAAMCGQSLLAAASLATQAHANIESPDGRSLPITLWAMTIAESGERKSAVDRIALAPHKQHEEALAAIYTDEFAGYRLALTAHEIAVEQVKKVKGKTPDEIRAALEACGEAPPPPVPPMLTCREPTFEGIQKLYIAGCASLGLFSDEGAEFFGGHAMHRDNRQRTIGGFCKLWDDGSSDRIRAADGATKLLHRRLAMHVMMQPVIAERVLGDDVLAGQGFLARTLLCWPTTTAGTRTFRPLNPAADLRVVAYTGRVAELLARAPELRARGELSPRLLSLSSSARRAWIEFHDGIEAAIAPEGRYGQIRPWASKTAEQALRIAGVLALVGAPDARSIDGVTMQHATALAHYYLEEALRIVGTAQVPDDVRGAEAVLAYCRQRGIRLIDSQTLIQSGPNRVRSGDALTAAMDVLVRRGWATFQAHAELKGRRVRRAWSLILDHAPPATPATVATEPTAEASPTVEGSNRSDGSSPPAPDPGPAAGGPSTSIHDEDEDQDDDDDDETGSV